MKIALSSLLHKIETTPTLNIITFLFFVTLIAYANTFGNGLFYDDEQFIYKNVYVQNFQFIEFFIKNVDAGAGVVSNYYRPLTLLTFGIEHFFFGYSSFIYHFDNFLLHALCGIFLYLILKKTFPKFVALLTSILFLIHPVQTEAVSYAAGRSDSLAFLFILLTIYTFFSKNKRISFLSIPFFFFALLGKEPAIVTPALILLIFFYNSQSFTKTLSSIKKFIPLVLTGGLYFLLRITVLNFQNTLNFYNDTSPYATSMLVRLFTFLSILPTYLGLLLYPKTLFIERVAPVVTSPTPLIVIVSFILLFLFSLSIFLITKRQFILFFSLLWFFISIALSSGIIIPINGIIYEHFLYVPSIGVFLLFSYATYILLQKTQKPIFLFLILSSLSVIIPSFMLRTISRNAEWRDPITFYTQTLHFSPKTARIHNNLAMAYAEEGRSTDAITEYKKALQINNTYPQIHFNLGRLYKQTDQKKFKLLLSEVEEKAKVNQSLIQLVLYFRSL